VDGSTYRRAKECCLYAIAADIAESRTAPVRSLTLELLKKS